jgi:hypothetical protein
MEFKLSPNGFLTAVLAILLPNSGIPVPNKVVDTDCFYIV